MCESNPCYQHDIDVFRGILGKPIALFVDDHPGNPLFKALKTPYPESRDRYAMEPITIRSAFRHINHADPKWLNAMIKERLCSNDDDNNRAALSEVIAYHYLHMTGFKVTPPGLKRKTPNADFVICDPEGTSIIVEVFAKQVSGHVRTKREMARKELDEAVKKAGKPGVYCKTTYVQPYGSGKGTAAENAIRKLSEIKEKEHQLRTDTSSILWIDIGSTGDFDLGNSDFTSPLVNHNGQITSGHYWYSMYGRTGLPIYNAYDIQLRPPYCGFSTMDYDGRLIGKSRLSGTIFRFEKDTVFFEHPTAAKPITDMTRLGISLLPQYRIEKSVANYYPGMVGESTAASLKCIASFAPNK